MSPAKGTAVGAWIRQFHRWLSIAFTATVIANFIVREIGSPPAWMTYPPLLPLAVLLLTGLTCEFWRHGGPRRATWGCSNVQSLGSSLSVVSLRPVHFPPVCSLARLPEVVIQIRVSSGVFATVCYGVLQ
jgi:hypothetical protein